MSTARAIASSCVRMDEVWLRVRSTYNSNSFSGSEPFLVCHFHPCIHIVCSCTGVRQEIVSSNYRKGTNNNKKKQTKSNTKPKPPNIIGRTSAIFLFSVVNYGTAELGRKNGTNSFLSSSTNSAHSRIRQKRKSRMRPDKDQVCDIVVEYRRRWKDTTMNWTMLKKKIQLAQSPAIQQTLEFFALTFTSHWPMMTAATIGRQNERICHLHFTQLPNEWMPQINWKSRHWSSTCNAQTRQQSK